MDDGGDEEAQAKEGSVFDQITIAVRGGRRKSGRAGRSG
jgi:hypothetical protein